VQLTWNHDARYVQFYTIYRSEDGVNFSSIGILYSDGSTSPNYTDYNANDLTDYTYKVTAHNDAGDSEDSNVATVSTPFIAPVSFYVSSASTNSITLSWSDDSQHEDGYYIVRDDQGSPTYLSTDTTSFTDNVSENNSYTYHLFAYRGTDVVQASPLTVTTGLYPPSNVNASANGNSEITISWQNNSSYANEFVIEQSTDGYNFYDIGHAASYDTSYTDSGLTQNTTYYYRIRILDSNGNSSQSDSTSATTSNDSVPDAPTNFTASLNDSTSINLSWFETSENASAFTISRSTDGSNFDYLTSVGGGSGYFSFLDAGLSSNTSYVYSIVATSNAGDSNSAQSNWVTTGYETTPDAPTNVYASTNGPYSINLSWYESSSNATGFTISRSTDGYNFDYITNVGGGSGNFSFEDNGVSPNSNYIYSIVANSNVGDSGATQSNWVSTGDIEAVPDAPSSFSASANSAYSVSLSWYESSSNATGFTISRSADGSNFYSVTSVSGGSGYYSYEDTGLSPSSSYIYSIVANSNVGDSGASQSGWTTTYPDDGGGGGDTTPPDSPYNFNAYQNGSNNITLSWIDGSGDTNSYTIFRALDENSYYPVTTISSYGSGYYSYDDSGLSQGNYIYYVYATRNGYDSSPTYSGWVSISDGGGGNNNPPSAPTAVLLNSAGVNNLTVSFVDSYGDANEYYIERSTDGNSFNYYYYITSQGADTYTFNDTSINEGNTYYYRVYASNSYGNSGYSAVEYFSNPPVKPDNVSASTVSETEIYLSWKDNSSIEDGYAIERSTDGNSFDVITTVGSDSTSFTDTNLSPGSTYYYHIRAYTSGGMTSISDTVSGDTLPMSPPETPQKFDITGIMDTEIDLEWYENSSNAAGFIIDRHDENNGTIQVADIPASGSGTYNYADIGLTPSTDYTYFIYAYNAGGASESEKIGARTLDGL
jgi:hypothetical protein